MKTSLQPFIIILFFVTLFGYINLSAQTSPLEYTIYTYQFESEVYDGDGTRTSVPTEILIGEIQMEDIPWLQLHFSDYNLGNQSYIIIKSLFDGKWQKLDAVSIKQWNSYSAFFNGNAVEIKLYLFPTDHNIFIKINELNVGKWSGGALYESICGPTDDRVASNKVLDGKEVKIPPPGQ